MSDAYLSLFVDQGGGMIRHSGSDTRLSRLRLEGFFWIIGYFAVFWGKGCFSRDDGKG